MRLNPSRAGSSVGPMDGDLKQIPDTQECARKSKKECSRHDERGKRSGSLPFPGWIGIIHLTLSIAFVGAHPLFRQASLFKGLPTHSNISFKNVLRQTKIGRASCRERV